MTTDFTVDEKVWVLLQHLSSDPEAAVKLLTATAECLRARQPLPTIVADFLADAIEASMGKPAEYRAKALTDELGLTANNRRPAAYAYDVGFYIAQLMREDGRSMSDAAAEVAHDYNIAESTARAYYKKYVADGGLKMNPANKV